MKKLYTVAQAAEMLSYSKSHTRLLIRKGRLNVAGKGDGRSGNYRLSEENINEFIKSLGV